jgi:hypothetical protein
MKDIIFGGLSNFIKNKRKNKLLRWQEISNRIMENKTFKIEFYLSHHLQKSLFNI